MQILFLEDEPTIREVLTEYMKMQNYDVICAGDGKEALEYLKTGHFDMAVLDIMVPKVSGLDVLAYIKEHKPEMATIMLTALGDEKTQVQAFNLYADDYVIKPVSPIILLKYCTSSICSKIISESDIYCGGLHEQTTSPHSNNFSLSFTVSISFFGIIISKK